MKPHLKGGCGRSPHLRRGDLEAKLMQYRVLRSHLLLMYFSLNIFQFLRNNTWPSQNANVLKHLKFENCESL